MPEFRMIKRTDVPTAGVVSERVRRPIARLHRGGTCYFSVAAVGALSDRDCRVLAEFDERAAVLRVSVVGEKLPKGFTREDTFPLRVRTSKRNKRAIGMLSLKALLRYIGFEANGAQDLKIVEIDSERHTLSMVLPPEQLPPCDDSLH